jgi:hypothetical protein
MPRTSLSAGSNRNRQEADRFPAFGLETGESGRLWIVSEELGYREWVHTLKAPTFEDNGKPVTEIKTRGDKKSEVYKTFFIGRQICTGSDDTLAESDGLDPDTCMICAFVKKMLDLGIGDARDLRAEPRYAVPVVQYTTQSKTDASLRNPPNGTVLVWSFTQWVWERLDKLRKDAGELLDKDPAEIKLEMFDIELHCSNGAFKNYDELKARRSAARDPQVREMLRALWGNVANRPTDEQLEGACGRRQNAQWTARDCEDAEEAWRQAHAWNPANAGRGGSTAVSGDDGNLDDTLSAILEDEPHPGGLAEFAPQGGAKPAAGDDVFAGLDDTPAESKAADAGSALDVFAGLDDTPEPAGGKEKASVGAGAVDSFSGILEED